PVLTPQVYALARRVADRAAGGASDILRLAVPKRQVRVEKAWLAAERAQPSPFEPAAVADYGTARIDEAIVAAQRLAMDAVPQVVEAGSPASCRWVGRWAVTLAAVASRALQA